MTKKVKIKELLTQTGYIDLQLRLLAGKGGLEKEIKTWDLNRPGLTLAGFYNFFAFERIQICGLGESAFLEQMDARTMAETCEKFFFYDILCCIFTHNKLPADIFLEYADKKNVPVFVSPRDTTKFTSLLMHFLEEMFSPRLTLHGTLVDVFGIGVLLIGNSGVGKSECALELVERGHRLVGDDMVEIIKVDDSQLVGIGSPILKHHMEIRGIGIINVRDIFGIRSVRNRKIIELVVLLEEWDSAKIYDRLGLEEKKHSILDTELPFITVPVRPGRNIPIIIEAAALNQRLKKLGVYSAQELDRRIQDWIRLEGADK